MINLFELDKLSATERDALLQRTEADLSAFIAPVAGLVERVREAAMRRSPNSPPRSTR